MFPYLSAKHIFAAAIITLTAALAHNLMPEKRSTIVPSAEKKLVLFFDGKHGGNSRGYWDARHASKAICEINPGEDFPYCGFLFSLGDGSQHGLDFTGYDGIRVNLKYSGPAPRLRIFMRNHEPAFSEPGKVETAKFNNITVPAEDLLEPLYLHLSDFSVAEWWQQASGVPRELSQPAFTNIIKFGFDLPSPVTYGRHELQLDRLELVGKWVTKKDWYLGIFAGWMTFAILWVLQNHVTAKRRLIRDERRLAELTRSEPENSEVEERDPLTRAVSRAGLRRIIRRLHLDDTHCRPFAMVSIDVDNFRKISRCYGHDGANEVLKTLGQLLMNMSRASDIVCHWSDDRFLLIAPSANAVELAVFAETIRNRIRQHAFQTQGRTFFVSVSAGVAQSSPNPTFAQVFEAADQALMQAKASGKNTVHNSQL